MKLKLQQQNEPNESEPPHADQVQVEINSFLGALNSYPAHVAKEPGLRFDQYLRSCLSEACDTHRPNATPRAKLKNAIGWQAE